MNERQFQQAVIDAARVQGWRVAHFRTARTQSGGWSTPVQADGAGFPDLVLVKSNRLVFAELKAQKGRLSEAQVTWLDALGAVASGIEDATHDVELEFGFGAYGATNPKPGVEVHVWKPSDWDMIEQVLAA